MPKDKNVSINIDILKPQSQAQKIPIRILKWVLSAGRYLIVFVEIIVLAALVSRFKLDNDIIETKEEIDIKAPFVQSLKPDEDLIKKFQSQIATNKDLKSKRPPFVDIINKTAAQTPSGISLSNITFENEPGKTKIKLTGVAQNNDQLATFIFGLRSEPGFSGVNLANVSLEQGQITFSISYEIASSGVQL